ncbi:MAG: ROK family protein [Bryobacteraceae bacterium]
MKTIAIDIGGTKFSIAGFEDSSVVLRESRDTNRDGGPEWMMDQFAQIVREWRGRAGFRADVCGIGFGGPVDFPSQTVTFSTHVGGWNSFPLIARIQQIAEAPVVMDNDANTGALGEGAFGAGIGFDPLFYMTISTGIGGGIVSRGEVWRGADSYGGEIGHLTIQRDGPECLCGSHGCLERLCCGLWLERDYGKPATELFLDPGFVTGYVVNLAQGVKAAIMLLNPARIVIGGGISKAGDRLFVPLRRELRKQITSWSRARLDVVQAGLGDDSVLYGAYVLAQGIL